MTQIVFPNTLTAGEVAKASEVMANLNAIKTVVDSQLTNANLQSGADIGSDKIANLAITTALIASNAVTSAKMAQDTAGSEGIGTNLNELFTEADAAYTNDITGRKQHGGKIISVYVSIEDTTRVTIDDSIDWRERVLAFIVTGTDDTHKAAIPDGASDDSIRGQSWVAGPTLQTTFTSGVFFTEKGSSDGDTDPKGQFVISQTGQTFIANFSADTSGNLTLKVQTFPGGGTALTLTGILIVGPYLGTA